MAVSRSKTWIAAEVLTASDLNAEFNNILDNGEDLGWPATKAKDLNGQRLIFDADADSYIEATTDDEIGVFTGGTERFRITDSVPIVALNLIINGAMDVSQRGTTFAGVGASATEYTLDRWLVYTSGSPQARATVTRETTGVFGGFGNSAKIDCTTAEAAVGAGELWSWQQRFQAQDFQQLRYGNAAAKILALRFKIKSPKSGTHCVALYQPDATRSYVREFTVASADTEEEITVTFPGDASGTINNDSGEGLRLTWPLVAGSDFQIAADAWTASEDYATASQQNLLDNTDNNFEITGIQLELGPLATPFEWQPLTQTLELCQRYYCKTFAQGTTPAQNAGIQGALHGIGSGGGSSRAHLGWRFPTTMRATPTVITYNPSAVNAFARNSVDNSDTTVTVGSARDSALSIRTDADATDADDDLLIHATAEVEL